MFAKNNAFDDQTWQSVTLMTWTDIESSIYLIAACLPSLRPLLRAVAQPSFKKHYWSSGTHPLSEEHARSKGGARVTYSGADGFQRLDGEHGNLLKAERGEYSSQTISSGGVTLDEDLELAQLTVDGRIRVTNSVQVRSEGNKAHMHGQGNGNIVIG